MVMQLMLDDESGIPIPLDDFALEAWAVQFNRALASEQVDVLCERLAECFASSLAECLDADLRPPSEAQVRLATDISRHLGVSMPPEALRFRAAMFEFLDRFADIHRTRWRPCRKRDT